MNETSFVFACTLLGLTWLNMKDMAPLRRRRRSRAVSRER